MRRLLAATSVALVICALTAAPALACSGLIGPRGAVSLGRTTTLAAYHAGVEHYVTAFDYAGGGGKFGSIVPLPGIPSKVERGGDWTLQRLVREVRPPQAFAAEAQATNVRAGSSDDARVVLEAKVDALDITVLEGGAFGVGKWAKEHGFVLPPDAPKVLDFYARRSPYFMAAVFDGDAAEERGQTIGDGTPIHLTIPTGNPWIPLRILSLGKSAEDAVNADLFMLTDRKPALLPVTAEGFVVQRRERASDSLLADLRSDKGMDWMPASMWLTHISVDSPARAMRFDLAADVHGGNPSRTAAGLQMRARPRPTPPVVETPVTATPVPVAAPTPQAPVVAARAVRADAGRGLGVLGAGTIAVALAAGGALLLRGRRRV